MKAKVQSLVPTSSSAAINHCAELVTAQARVEALRRKYCMLVSEKAELKHSSVVQTSSDS